MTVRIKALGVATAEARGVLASATTEAGLG